MFGSLVGQSPPSPSRQTLSAILTRNNVKNLSDLYLDAKNEFFNSKHSEKSIENLYDILYYLADIKERSFDQNYILADIYYLIGEHILASKTIEKALLNSEYDEAQRKMLMSIEQRIEDDLNKWDLTIQRYRDLRDSKKLKSPTILKRQDFIIKEDVDGTYCLKISHYINSIVILNKRLLNIDDLCKLHEYHVFSEIKPETYLLDQLITHIQWLGALKDELIDFYNNESFHSKLSLVGQEWFDGLNVYDFTIYINNQNDFKTHLIVQDYIQNDYGFHLEILNEKIIDIEYDANL